MKPILAVILLAALANSEPPAKMAGRVRIEQTESGTVRFTPAEIVAWAGQQIHWFNDTGEVHEPGVLKKDGTFVPFLEEPVAARNSSAVFSPLARIDDKTKKQVAFTIEYVCARHRDEKGTIQVIPTP
jgi:plastocyanin